MVQFCFLILYKLVVCLQLHFQKSVASKFVKWRLLLFFQNKTQSHGGLHMRRLKLVFFASQQFPFCSTLFFFNILTLKNCCRPIRFLHACNFCILIEVENIAEFGFNTYRLNPSGYAYKRRPSIKVTPLFFEHVSKVSSVIS